MSGRRCTPQPAFDIRTSLEPPGTSLIWDVWIEYAVGPDVAWPFIVLTKHFEGLAASTTGADGPMRTPRSIYDSKYIQRLRGKVGIVGHIDLRVIR